MVPRRMAPAAGGAGGGDAAHRRGFLVTCMLAPSIEWLWIARIGRVRIAGAGMVVGRAVIRDLLDGAEAQRADVAGDDDVLRSRIAAVAPLVGGAIPPLWLAVHLRVSCAVRPLLGWVSEDASRDPLQERRQSLSPRSSSARLTTVFRARPSSSAGDRGRLQFQRLSIYVLSAPAFLIEHLGRSPQAFGWLFVPGVIGMMAGSMLSGGCWPLEPARAIATGFVVMGAAQRSMGAEHSLPFALLWSVLPIMTTTSVVWRWRC